MPASSRPGGRRTGRPADDGFSDVLSAVAGTSGPAGPRPSPAGKAPKDGCDAAAGSPLSTGTAVSGRPSATRSAGRTAAIDPAARNEALPGPSPADGGAVVAAESAEAQPPGAPMATPPALVDVALPGADAQLTGVAVGVLTAPFAAGSSAAVSLGREVAAVAPATIPAALAGSVQAPGNGMPDVAGAAASPFGAGRSVAVGPSADAAGITGGTGMGQVDGLPADQRAAAQPADAELTGVAATRPDQTAGTSAGTSASMPGQSAPSAEVPVPVQTAATAIPGGSPASGAKASDALPTAAQAMAADAVGTTPQQQELSYPAAAQVAADVPADPSGADSPVTAAAGSTVPATEVSSNGPASAGAPVPAPAAVMSDSGGAAASVPGSQTAAAPAAPAASTNQAPTAVPQPVDRTPAQQMVMSVAPMRRAADGSYALSLQLHPADLGAVQVQMEMRAGTVSLQLQVENGAARELVRESLPQLRAELAASGLTAGSIDVRDDSRQGADQRSAFDPAPGGDGRQRRNQSSASNGGTDRGPAVPVSSTTRGSADRTLDIRL
ncbi:MAG: flagellar hook-length control protein FliK [Actinomycetota bacterium]|nr:flagellar hook-length control protein FliK [Actinomycetota bacterium]